MVKVSFSQLVFSGATKLLPIDAVGMIESAIVEKDYANLGVAADYVEENYDEEDFAYMLRFLMAHEVVPFILQDEYSSADNSKRWCFYIGGRNPNKPLPRMCYFYRFELSGPRTLEDLAPLWHHLCALEDCLRTIKNELDWQEVVKRKNRPE